MWTRCYAVAHYREKGKLSYAYDYQCAGIIVTWKILTMHCLFLRLCVTVMDLTWGTTKGYGIGPRKVNVNQLFR